MENPVCRLGVALLLLIAAGCGAIQVSEGGYRHMLCVDPDGGPAEIEVPQRRETAAPNHDAHVKEIVGTFRKWKSANPDGKLVLVLHGGMVSMADAVQQAEKIYPLMMEEGNVYPVFINWETGLGKSYFDHLFRIRYGQANGAYGSWTWPFLLVGDLGRSLTRYPVTLLTQFSSIGTYYFGDPVQPVPDRWEHTAWLDPRRIDNPAWANLVDIGAEIVPGALRLATTPILDTMGIRGFHSMQRRARVLFLRDIDFVERRRLGSGALEQLMAELDRWIDPDNTKAKEKTPGAAKHSGTATSHEECMDEIETSPATTPADGVGKPLQIDILAHSMGCIVANRLLQRWGSRQFKPNNCPNENLKYDFRNVVFMGAACTIKDFADTTLRYIAEHPDCKFYNLCLHPYAEQDDRYLGGIVPHGSLLEWIDNFITEQSTAMDFTLGKWNNVMRILPMVDFLPSKVRERIVIRGFPHGGTAPHNHMDFNDARHKFWQPRFWDFREDPMAKERWDRGRVNRTN